MNFLIKIKSFVSEFVYARKKISLLEKELEHERQISNELWRDNVRSTAMYARNLLYFTQNGEQVVRNNI